MNSASRSSLLDSPDKLKPRLSDKKKLDQKTLNPKKIKTPKFGDKPFVKPFSTSPITDSKTSSPLKKAAKKSTVSYATISSDNKVQKTSLAAKSKEVIKK